MPRKPVEEPRPFERTRDKVVVLGLAALLSLPACDSFFGVRGHVVDCVSAAPLAGVTIDVHVDRGYRDRVETLKNVAKTDAKGAYAFDINDPSESWATLTFAKSAYESYMTEQLQGHRQDDPPLDLCLQPVGLP